MQTRRSSRIAPSAHIAARIAVGTLTSTKDRKPINLEEIAQKAGTTSRITERILSKFFHIDKSPDGDFNNSTRLRLALEAARLGAIPEIAKALTWQEFESFSTECLSSAGFQTQKGVIFNDGERKWQIDIVAKRGLTVLAIDCKHWKPPNYASKFTKAAQHQRLALEELLREPGRIGDIVDSGDWALPVILTLFEPRERTLNGVVLVSVGQFPDFLEHVTPYDPELPFIPGHDYVESSIS